MKYVMALETTSDICSVAIGNLQHMVENTRVAPRLHNALLLGLIDDCLQAIGATLDDCECIAYSRGPGSFTGIRIGASVAQGIAFARNLPVCGIDTSAVMARIAVSMTNMGSFRTTRISRRNLVYSAKHSVVDGKLQTIEPDVLTEDAPDETLTVVPDSRVALSAKYLMEIALESRDNWDLPEMVLPNYVEGDTPWKPAF